MMKSEPAQLTRSALICLPLARLIIDLCFFRSNIHHRQQRVEDRTAAGGRPSPAQIMEEAAHLAAKFTLGVCLSKKKRKKTEKQRKTRHLSEFSPNKSSRREVCFKGKTRPLMTRDAFLINNLLTAAAAPRLIDRFEIAACVPGSGNLNRMNIHYFHIYTDTVRAYSLSSFGFLKTKKVKLKTFAVKVEESQAAKGGACLIYSPS